MRSEDAVQSKIFESVAQKFSRRLRRIALSPVRHAQPVAQFGLLMLQGKPQADASAQTSALAKSNGEADFVVAVTPGKEISCFLLGVGMRNAQRGRRDFSRSDEGHQFRDVGLAEGTQLQPGGLESRMHV